MQDKSKSARSVTPASHAGQVTGDKPSNCDPPESPAPASEPGGPAPGHTGPASEPGPVTDTLPNVVIVDEFTVTDPGVTITMVDDQQEVVGRLRLTIEQLHQTVENALLQGHFNHSAFLKVLGVGFTPESAEEQTYAVLNDYLGGEIPLPYELVWDALVFGLIGGES